MIFMIQEAIDRIKQMEMYFDMLKEAADTDPALFMKDPEIKEILRVLIQYYEGGQWLYDYELDEKGLLPQTLKRGVLSQDAVYDLLDQIKSQADQ